MSHLYVMESDVKLGFSQGRIVVKKLATNEERSIPFSDVEGISIFGHAQLSTQLIRECIASDVSISYYSDDGRYFGRTSSFNGINPERQKSQIALTDNASFCLEWSKRTIRAKIANSLTLLKELENSYELSAEDLHGLHHSLKNLEYASSVEEVMGFEGNAAKSYYKCLSKFLESYGFSFAGRSTRPPKDPFNSMISYGYSLLYRNIIGAIERHGLHSYFAFMHKTRQGHASLASDLIEDYRAYLVDRVVIKFILAGDIDPSEFYQNDAGAIYMKRGLARELTNRFTDAQSAAHPYFNAYDDKRLFGFQTALDMKVSSVISAIDEKNPTAYKPFVWEMCE